MTQEELKAYQAGQFINQIGNAIKNGVIEEIESTVAFQSFFLKLQD